jgi:hypothetical protein
MFHGKRHKIASPRVYESLFKDSEGLVLEPNPESIAEGPLLVDGTCLIRAEGSTSIYLVTAGESGIIRRHLIVNWESMLDFRFDESKTITVPSLLVEGLAWGRDLSSPEGRRHLRS